jgi:Trk-type K+ transport system membrane component
MSEAEQNPPTLSAAFPSVPSHALTAWPMVLVGALAIASLVLQHGFQGAATFEHWLGWFDVFLATAFALNLVLNLSKARRPREAVRARRFELFLLGILILLSVLLALLPGRRIAPLLDLFKADSTLLLFFGLTQFFLLANVCLQLMLFIQKLFIRGVRPEAALAGSFACLILIGSLLLLLPRSTATGSLPLSAMDAIFTATSASCVTGLVVRDTGSELSTFGQMIVLALFQVGGLGIITFVAFVSVFSERSLPMPQMLAFRQIINAPGLSDLKQRIVGIILLTFLIEMIGAIALYLMTSGPDDFPARFKWACFHSVSAFCNAGFALHANSLEAFQHNVAINFTIATLIVLGGLGLLVIPELTASIMARVRRRGTTTGHAATRPGARTRLSVQTKLTLGVTGSLIVFGFLGFWMLEARHSLNHVDPAQSALTSLFQSITTRTAGFNTVPIGDLGQSTLLLLMMLMVVGASPVSAGGGIKTVTFGILLLALRSMLMRRDKVEAFGRTLPPRALYAALSVFVLYVLTAATGLFTLTLLDPHIPLRDLSFETISALSTVGLSTGITPHLSAPSQLVLCLLMFIGRVGPISLVLSVFQSQTRLDYEFPTEEVVVG